MDECCTSIPEYFRRRWRDYVECRYYAEARRFEDLTAMEVDCRRPPFLCAGNLESGDETRWILTFGLAPHSRSERVPASPSEYYQWRIGYFDTTKMPHQIHSHFANLCRGVCGVDCQPERPDPRWLHRNVLTFDLVPYYVRHWKWKAKSHGRELLGLIGGHFASCLGLLGHREIRFAVFCGKAWGDLLVSDTRLCSFTSERSFPLDTVTGKASHRPATIHVGGVSAEGRSFRAMVVPRSIHGQAAISYPDLWQLGRHVRSLLL